jgi:ATP-dependent exoDNAse (exonuclease V) beta subunit
VTSKGSTKTERATPRPALADQEDRNLIAEDLDATLIVEAAAGTGKTTELVNRIVRVIETGRANITEIVSVTFTEKAAGELKLRLREALEEAKNASQAMVSPANTSPANTSPANASPAISARRADRPGAGDTKRDEYLNAAISKLEEAQISTIHGFCADLLRERPVEARVDPLFTVLNDAQAQRLYDSAFNTWFQEKLADPPEGIQRSLRRPVFSAFGIAADKEEGPIDRLRNAGWDLIQWRDFKADWQRRPFDRAARIDHVVHRLREFAEISAGPDSQNDNLHFDTRPARQLSDDIQRTEAVMPRDYSRLEAALVDLSRNRQFRGARKGSGRYKSGVSREAVLEARKQLQADLERFEIEANADLAALLCRELRECVQRYEDEKAKAGALDFLDLLLKARDLVLNDETVRRSFQERFKRIFVDEFQDTDPLQAEILLLLAADDPSVANFRKIRPVPGKLFIVGDPKQSIYRFRRADVGIYRDVYAMLEKSGAKRVTLRTSFRARPNIQSAINAAFEPLMGDVLSGSGDSGGSRDSGNSPGYVPLEPFRSDVAEQPTVVVLPVPQPYGTRRVSNVAIEGSLPDAVGAYVDWLIKESGWRVAERASTTGLSHAGSAALGFKPGESERLVPVQARHICLLFRRFTSYGADMTRPYVLALEARGIPHLLVGGRSFHNRAEIETLRAALAAIEWPDDELSVFATLRGSLFAIGDEELLEYRARFGAFHPFRIPRDLSGEAPSAPILSALSLLQSLHRSRNHIPVASTISRLLAATRAHVRFALEHGGEQVLANVLHVAELARRYEADGGISFRGFIDELREQAEDGQAGEAPILEEGSDGVRMMTVHKAKGLEFPVVILADITAKLQPSAANRYLDPISNTCAVRLAGCSPFDLIEHEQDEIRRDEAEGIRLVYVAATRARDLLIVPAVGDEERDGWIEPLNRAIYPPIENTRQQVAAPGCPQFKTKDSVLSRPDDEEALTRTVSPGLHTLQAHNGVSDTHQCVWWDPRHLLLGAEPPLGIRRSELIVKDVPQAIVDEGLAAYRLWRDSRDVAVATAKSPSIAAQPAKAWAASKPERTTEEPPVEVIELPRDPGRPAGVRFGTLVHAALATVPFNADAPTIQRVVFSHARVLGATEHEAAAAAHLVQNVLAHPILHRARDASVQHRCRREVPVTFRTSAGLLVEGIVDLAFKEGEHWTIVDFKTDEELRNAFNYDRQIRLYGDAVLKSTGKDAKLVLMRI